MKANDMTMADYQIGAYRAIRPHVDDREEILHWVIGLTEEAGEVASLIKHKYFHNEDIFDTKIAEELGDVLWYVSAMCTVLDISLADIARINLAKLRARFADGMYSDKMVQCRHDKDKAVQEIAGQIMSRKE